MKEKLKKIREAVWELPQEGEMRTPMRVYATEKILGEIEAGAFQQGVNVSYLPGIQKYSIMLPDAHYGYGFPIGGVAAFDKETGVVSPGGTGFDINCGVRLLSTNLKYEDVKPKLKTLVEKLFENIPAGVGSKGRLRVTDPELKNVLVEGARWAVENGYGNGKDLEHMEENGKMEDANPEKCSQKAFQRGRPQLGTLGAGNHFLEIQRTDEIYEPETAEKFGIREEGQITVMVHCGSRGFGHQVADEYIRVMEGAMKKYNISLPDRQLACAPLGTKEAEDYLQAMRCAVNYAFCNRQVITHWVRETFAQVFGEEQEMPLIYDVCHNIAKFEEYDGKELCVHRKGATRAFGPGRKEIPKAYRSTGQPVIIPGSMGTASYLMVGTKTAEEETFGSTCHGAGRTMSRHAAISKFRGENIQKTMEERGQYVKATAPISLAEEAAEAYKDIDEVIKSVDISGIAKKVARVVPLGVTKG